MSDNRPGWDEWAIGVSRTIAERSDCTRAKIGAVVLDVDGNIIGEGYIGTASGRLGCLEGGCPRGQRTEKEVPHYSSYDEPGPGYCISTHAEMNALLRADFFKLDGATMYVTQEPCKWCSKVIGNTPIRRIVFSGNNGKLVSRLV